MAEKKETINKQVNNNKPNPSTIKNSWKTLGYTLYFRADNSPTLPHPHPQIQIMNRPDKKKNNTQHFRNGLQSVAILFGQELPQLKAIVVREPSVSVWLSSLLKRAKSLRPQK